MARFPPRNSGVTSRMRLRDYDYATPGYYFLTLCINDWSCRLGTIPVDAFLPHPAGDMVKRIWLETPHRFPGVSLDEYCLMPNHFHAIIGIGIEDGSQPLFPSIIRIMDWFKSLTTVEYIRGVRDLGWPSYRKRLWLDGYYDHIIRDDHDLDRIRTYIQSNAANWHRDSFNTSAKR